MTLDSEIRLARREADAGDPEAEDRTLALIGRLRGRAVEFGLRAHASAIRSAGGPGKAARLGIRCLYHVVKAARAGVAPSWQHLVHPDGARGYVGALAWPVGPDDLVFSVRTSRLLRWTPGTTVPIACDSASPPPTHARIGWVQPRPESFWPELGDGTGPIDVAAVSAWTASQGPDRFRATREAAFEWLERERQRRRKGRRTSRAVL